MLKLLIADDHLLFMEGLALVLRDRFLGSVIHQASHLREVKQQLQDNAPFDLLLLDRTMPGVDSLQHLQAFWDIVPDLRIAVISAADAPHYIQEALGLGVVGFISKASPPDVMVEAIQHILRGGIYIPASPSPIRDGEAAPLTDATTFLQCGATLLQIARCAQVHSIGQFQQTVQPHRYCLHAVHPIGHSLQR